MKNRFVLFTFLLTLALLTAACAAQDATNQPEEITAMPTVATEVGTGTEGADEAEMTPTAATEAAPPAQESGGTAEIPVTGLGEAGLPDDLDEVIIVLSEAGATLELGKAVEHDLLSVPGQVIWINGEEVQIFTYDSTEELEVQVSQVADEGDPEDEPHFYKLGTMIVRYAGSDPGVRDLLEDVLGAQDAGQE